MWVWAGLGLIAAEPATRFSLVRICIASIHLVAGLLLIIRLPEKQRGSVTQILPAVPAVVVSGFAFQHAPGVNTWNAGAVTLFGIGTAATLLALVWIGDSFAILPAVRRIVSRGPYAIVRHPIYVGELLLVGACTMARPDALAGLILSAAVVFVVVRIVVEEELLTRHAAYQDYAARVRWRLVPGVW